MPFFSYTARDRSGRQTADSIESDSRDAAIMALRQQGLLVLQIDEVKSNRSGERDFSLNPFDHRSIRIYDIERAFHELAVMLRSGISVLDGLAMIRKHSRIGCKVTWQSIIDRIEQGGSLTDAVKEHKIFPNLTVHLIAVGEKTGMLHMVLDQAAEELLASRKLKKQITGALRYPAFTLLVAIGVIVLMLTTIIPEIKKLLVMMGKPMPPLTQALIDISDWFVANGIAIGIGIAVFAVVFILLYNWPPSRYWIDRGALRVPIFGNVFRLSGTVLFTRSMGLLLRSGVLIDEALAIMEQLHTNQYMASRVAFARERILLGSTLAEPLEARPVYTPLVLQMVRVGENSGTLDEILLEMTDYHDELLQQAIAKLTGMIAPAMTIFVGGIIGFVYAAFLVAMFSAAGGSPS